MNIEALCEMADYLDKGGFGGRKFDMRRYNECVLGHCAAMELTKRGQPVDEYAVSNECCAFVEKPLSARVFGIHFGTDEYCFAFGAAWGTDPHAAADRLRYLARYGCAPDRSLWDLYNSSEDVMIAWEASAKLSLEPALC